MFVIATIAFPTLFDILRQTIVQSHLKVTVGRNWIHFHSSFARFLANYFASEPLSAPFTEFPLIRFGLICLLAVSVIS